MPHSYPHTEKYFIEDLRKVIKPNTCFDIGIGYGHMGQLVKESFPNYHITGFEIYHKYLMDKKEELERVYNTIHNTDFYDWLQSNIDWGADLIIFGDVLEHFNHSQAIDIIETCIYRSRYIAIKVPIEIQQNSYDNNIKEAHKALLGLEDFAKYNIQHYVVEHPLRYFLIKGLIQ